MVVILHITMSAPAEVDPRPAQDFVRAVVIEHCLMLNIDGLVAFYVFIIGSALIDGSALWDYIGYNKNRDEFLKLWMDLPAQSMQISANAPSKEAADKYADALMELILGLDKSVIVMINDWFETYEKVKQLRG